MNEDNHDAKQLGPLFSRHRSPPFSKDETKTLVTLIEKYKNIIQNKSTNTATCQAKELTWKKIATEYNSHAFRYKRSADSLRVKWDNLKRDARKVSKNLMEVDQDDVDEVTGQIVAMINEAENTRGLLLPEDFNFNEVIKDNSELKEPDGESENIWDENEDKDTPNNADENDGGKRSNINRSNINRSMNFTPQECSILLKCVRPEKKYVFSSENTSKAIRLKNRAWARVTHCFNKISPQKRTTRVLRTKFSNLRHRAKTETKNFLGVGSTNEYSQLKHEDNSNQKIKSEPAYNFDEASDSETEDDSRHSNDETNDNLNRLHGYGNSNHVELAPDPLSMVLNNGDSGLDSINFDTCPEKKEIAKLKMQLVQYQLETAKLERKRIEAAMSAEAEANQSRAVETALRLRAARLDAIAAAARLPPAHPALQYTAEEARAQQYLGQYPT